MKISPLKLYSSIISLFIAVFLYSQTYPEGLSNGTLAINEKEVPVKIFATTKPTLFEEFSMKNGKDAYLVIINDSNFEIGNPDSEVYYTDLIRRFYESKFQFLDSDFQPSREPVTIENISKIKYLYKNSDNIIKNSDSVYLKTKFKIWDPSTGISLGKFKLHYYSLMFVLAFGLGYVLMSKIFKIDQVHEKYLEPFFVWTLLGTIFGARIGHVIFYEPELFKEDFWAVFLPISTKNGFQFTGFSGLASHGATIMLIFTTLYYSLKIIQKNPLWVYDRLGIVVALGGAFVRIGNFFNSEIIGKPIDENSPFAILFPQMSWDYGATVPRYPTQLFEATGYFLLFILLWILYRKTNKKYQLGWLFGLFFIILWNIRFFVEFLKEPQGDEFIQIAGLNTGQVLSIPFIIIGIILMIISSKFKITKVENSKLD